MHWSFYLSLFVAIWFIGVNAIRAHAKQVVPPINFVIMSAAIVYCVYSIIEKS